MTKYYYEYDEIDEDWAIYEIDGGYESGGYYDVMLFCCSTEQDAIDAIECLIERE